MSSDCQNPAIAGFSNPPPPFEGRFPGTAKLTQEDAMKTDSTPPTKTRHRAHQLLRIRSGFSISFKGGGASQPSGSQGLKTGTVRRRRQCPHLCSSTGQTVSTNVHGSSPLHRPEKSFYICSALPNLGLGPHSMGAPKAAWSMIRSCGRGPLNRFFAQIERYSFAWRRFTRTRH